MTLTILKQTTKDRKIDNDVIYNCPADELVELLREMDFDEADNFHILVALPPERETTRGGIIIPDDQKQVKQFRTSVGRILSVGKTVGHGEILKECRDYKVGDYVKYAYYAAGNPERLKGIYVKYIADDQTKGRIKDPESISNLYDYAGR